MKTSEARAKVSAETKKLLNSLGENLKLDNKDISELAKALSNGYLKYAKENNKKIKATCSYALKWFEKNKDEYKDLYIG